MRFDGCDDLIALSVSTGPYRQANVVIAAGIVLGLRLRGHREWHFFIWVLNALRSMFGYSYCPTFVKKKLMIIGFLTNMVVSVRAYTHARARKCVYV